MIHLENGALRVSVLDPAADGHRLGSRYCAGGYVWQVEDRVHGNLLAGPRYPDPIPAVFDGQGLPEVFEIALGAAAAAPGDDVYVLGVGRVRRESAVRPFHVRDNPAVAERAAWAVEKSDAEISMVSRQVFAEWDLLLERRVVLTGRELASITTVSNRGKAEAPLRWFAHPFLPPADPEVGRLSLECAFPAWLPAAGGFRIEGGRIFRDPGYDWKSGCYQLLDIPFGAPLTIHQSHPLLGEAAIECRFPVAWLPLWGNANTVSFEPYFHTVLRPGNQTEWSIRYRF